MYEIESNLFFLKRQFLWVSQIWINILSLGRCVFLGGHLRLELPCIRVNAACFVYSYKHDNTSDCSIHKTDNKNLQYSDVLIHQSKATFVDCS